MRPSRSILALAIIASVPASAALGVLGGGATVNAAPTTSVHAPVAQAPRVVAHAVAAPKHTVASAKPAAKKPSAKPVVHHVTRTTAKPATATRTVTRAAAKPATAPVAQPAVHTGNDYPYAGATSNANDKWGFTERQCVSFAAWRLAKGGRAIDNAQGWGSAFHWDEAARANGVPVSATPHVGAIAQWNVGEAGKVWVNGGQGTFHAGEYGHVGYVAAVYSDGSVLVEQYNVMGDRNYTALRMTAPRYLF
ncbi:MAG: hypothetical protein JWO22_1141 [Frankiales bacterium]|nr:hypothetical protein [Frankiales bacterium]